MAFKMKGMTFGKGTSYKSPQLMAKEAAAKANRAARKAAASPKDMNYGSPKEYGSPKDMDHAMKKRKHNSPKDMGYGSPKDMGYGSPKDMD